jgi:23S rRNA (adenine2503-C2)-methyltransferase
MISVNSSFQARSVLGILSCLSDAPTFARGDLSGGACLRNRARPASMITMETKETMDLAQSVIDLTAAGLAETLRSLGEPSFRAKQVRRWVFGERVLDYAKMTDLPTGLREKLAGALPVLPLSLAEEVVSADGLTRKALFGLRDGAAVETVLMEYLTPPTPLPHGGRGETWAGNDAAPPRHGGSGEKRGEIDRRTVCVSSQVGCAVGCPFCATGASGFIRNLTAGEILGQVLYYAGAAREQAGPEARITNVVLMGMGEPLANFGEVWRAIELLNGADDFGLGARHVTISTAGLIPGIRELAAKPLQVGLAISLHAPDDELRDRLVPVNRRYPLAELIPACREYADATGRRVSFEYAMIGGLNDSVEQADRLADLLRGLLGHVNLIPLNPVAESPFQPSGRRVVLDFQSRLQSRGIPCTVRASRGDPIAAACGQLRARRLRTT